MGKRNIPTNKIRSYIEIKSEGTKKNRKCLKCENDFLSLGPGNRICKKCDLENEKNYSRENKSEKYKKTLSGDIQYEFRKESGHFR